MVNKILNILVVCSVLTLGWGCSSDSGSGSSDSQAEKPNWQLNLAANDVAPDWSVTNAEDYELTMSLGVKLSQVLAVYASDDDMLAAFIDGQCRSVATPSVYPGSGGTLVSAGLNIVGNAGENGVTFKYYCKRLNRIFTLTNWMNFNPNQNPSQGGSAYVLPFESELGRVAAQVTVQLPEGTAVDLSLGDEIALLADGSQCCSNVAWVGEKQVVLNVLAPQGKRLAIDWYCASKHAIYEAAETVLLNSSDDKAVTVTAFNIKKK